MDQLIHSEILDMGGRSGKGHRGAAGVDRLALLKHLESHGVMVELAHLEIPEELIGIICILLRKMDAESRCHDPKVFQSAIEPSRVSQKLGGARQDHPVTRESLRASEGGLTKSLTVSRSASQTPHGDGLREVALEAYRNLKKVYEKVTALNTQFGFGSVPAEELISSGLLNSVTHNFAVRFAKFTKIMTDDLSEFLERIGKFNFQPPNLSFAPFNPAFPADSPWEPFQKKRLGGEKSEAPVLQFSLADFLDANSFRISVRDTLEEVAGKADQLCAITDHFLDNQETQLARSNSIKSEWLARVRKAHREILDLKESPA